MNKLDNSLDNKQHVDIARTDALQPKKTAPAKVGKAVRSYAFRMEADLYDDFLVHLANRQAKEKKRPSAADVLNEALRQYLNRQK